MKNIWDYVEPEPNTGCFIWIGPYTDGFAIFQEKKKNRKAARVLYELLVGKIISRLMKQCTTPYCVNPAHYRQSQGDEPRICIKCGLLKPATEYRMRPLKQRKGHVLHIRVTTCGTCETKESTEWWRTPQGKATRRKRHIREWNDPVKREEIRKYLQTEHAKEVRRKRDASPKYKELRRQWESTDKGSTYLAAKWARHRARRLGIIREGTLTADQWRLLLEAYNFTCAYCPSKDKITMDHVVPLSVGGTHTMDNIVPACWECNMRKHTEIWKPREPGRPELLKS